MAKIRKVEEERKLLGYDVYMYESLEHSQTAFCYRFPPKDKKQAKRTLRNLAYGGFMIEVWSISYQTERLIEEYMGNPDLRPKPGSSPPNLHIQSGEMMPTNPPKYKHFTVEQIPEGTKITPKAHEGQDYDGH